MPATRAEIESHLECIQGSDRLKREIGYNPTRFTLNTVVRRRATSAQRWRRLGRVHDALESPAAWR